MGEFKKAQRESEVELREFEKELREKGHIEEKKDKIEKLALDLGIETEGKTEEEILDEINKAIPKSAP
jgi:sec-independent protein translocase protein TatA